MADIAAQAGVSTPMAFAAFQTKANLLTAAIRVAVRGDDSDVPLRATRDWETMLSSATGSLLIERFAAVQTSINGRAWALIDAGRAAAASDRTLSELVAAGAENRWADCREIASVLDARRQLASGIDADRAADLLWSMCSSELYRMLVVHRRWPPNSYERWLGQALATQLLQPDGRAPQLQAR